jgi:hypothetical protein
MKKLFSIDCHTAMDFMYGDENDGSLSILSQLQLRVHFLLCPNCANEQKRLLLLKEIMSSDFLPASPGFEEKLMGRLSEASHFYNEIDAEEKITPPGFSLRGWVVTGFFILLSLSSTFFGMNFNEIVNAEGASFLIPVGLTVGIVVTCYGAMFIGSHLNELSSRFGLR